MASADLFMLIAASAMSITTSEIDALCLQLHGLKIENFVGQDVSAFVIKALDLYRKLTTVESFQQQSQQLVLQNTNALSAILYRVDVSESKLKQTLSVFDNIWAPLHNFRDAADYYAQTSCAQFLPNIRLPTLILRALDDPFFPKGDIPHASIEANPYLQAHFPKHGGHLGFVEGRLPWRYRYWGERQVARFLAHCLLEGQSALTPQTGDV